MAKRIAVLVSGGGTNLQALLDAQAAGTLAHGEITLVVSSNEGAYALTRAANAGIRAQTISPKQCGGQAAFEAALSALLAECEIDLIVLAGFLTEYSADFLHTATAATYGEAFGGKAGDVVVGGVRRQNAAVNAPALRGVVVRENEENIGMLLRRSVRASCGHGENSDGGRA